MICLSRPPTRSAVHGPIRRTSPQSLATLGWITTASPMRRPLRSTLLATAGWLSASAALAQVTAANVRAVNLARDWAIKTNGGLAAYVPAACMFNTAAGGGPCLAKSGSEGFRFRFLGGVPGWQEQGKPPSRETVLQVSADGRTVSQVIYNGPPR